MTLEELRRQRQTVEVIHDVVSATRAIAAGRIQGAQHALEGARGYHAVVLRALAVQLAQQGEPAAAGRGERAPLGLLVMTSEQALCGAFNEHVLALAERRWRELSAEGPVQLMVVGQRGARQFAARGIPLAASEPAATTLGGLRDLVKRLALLLGRRYATGEIGSLRVVYSRHRSISEQEPTEEQILPPDLDRVRREVPPPARRYHRYLGPGALLAGLVHEYAFISLYRVAAESFASEQAARLVAMDGAMRNTERLLEDLAGLERRERQRLITQQVLELIGARFAARF